MEQVRIDIKFVRISPPLVYAFSILVLISPLGRDSLLSPFWRQSEKSLIDLISITIIQWCQVYLVIRTQWNTLMPLSSLQMVRNDAKGWSMYDLSTVDELLQNGDFEARL